MAKFYETKECPVELFENEYLLIKDQNGEYVDEKYRWNGKRLIKLNYKTVQNTYADRIKPKNFKQECAFDLLQNHKVPVKLITGSIGTGKTYLSLLHAVDYLEKEIYNKIIYIRNNIQVKNTNEIGHLPNGLKDKLLPYIAPLIDILGGSQPLEKWEKDNMIEYCHLGFLRGRNFDKSIVICSESENLTKEHMKTIIGRIGKESILIVEGDLSQVDKKVFEENSGIMAMREILKGNSLFGAVDLDKTERSPVAELSNLF